MTRLDVPAELPTIVAIKDDFGRISSYVVNITLLILLVNITLCKIDLETRLSYFFQREPLTYSCSLSRSDCDDYKCCNKRYYYFIRDFGLELAVNQLQVLLSKTFKNRKSYPMEILGTLTEFLFFEISTLKPILSLVPLLQTNGKLMSVLHVRFNLT